MGLWTRGLVLGVLAAMLAVGMALIYRANRVVNFAQADLGTVPTSFAAALILFWQWPYLVGLGAGLLIALLLGLVVEMAIIRRFRNAPRMVMTVATLGVTQLLIVLGILVPRWWGKNLASQRLRVAGRLEADAVGDDAAVEAGLQQVHPRRQRHHRDDRRAAGAGRSSRGS